MFEAGGVIFPAVPSNTYMENAYRNFELSKE